MKNTRLTKEEKKLAFAVVGVSFAIIIASCFIFGGYGFLFASSVIVGLLSN